MHSCHRKVCNRTVRVSVLLALLCATLLASVRPTRAQKTDLQTTKSTLVVWARTDLANQGAPTLDLERYFVCEPMKRGVTIVAASLTADNSVPDPDRIPEVIIATVLGLFVVIVIFLIHRGVEADGIRSQWLQLQQAWNQRLEEAKAKQLGTDNFADTWIRAAARERCDDILKEAAAIERQEAQRQVWAKQKEAEYQQIAAYATRCHGLDTQETVEILRNADLLPYRLLQEAKKQANGRTA